MLLKIFFKQDTLSFKKTKSENDYHEPNRRQAQIAG